MKVEIILEKLARKKIKKYIKNHTLNSKSMKKDIKIA